MKHETREVFSHRRRVKTKRQLLRYAFKLLLYTLPRERDRETIASHCIAPFRFEACKNRSRYHTCNVSRIVFHENLWSITNDVIVDQSSRNLQSTIAPMAMTIQTDWY